MKLRRLGNKLLVLAACFPLFPPEPNFFKYVFIITNDTELGYQNMCMLNSEIVFQDTGDVDVFQSFLCWKQICITRAPSHHLGPKKVSPPSLIHFQSGASNQSRLRTALLRAVMALHPESMQFMINCFMYWFSSKKIRKQK